ncbi:molybdopterin-dependent oxidoreductase [Specibacter sp. RAF43]|uniref:molybdopterin-dependent oxidoreductase n=1 Tax=Specibacter sp. RAF43 TaxID=3233057 RepID=UPI003F9C9106
MAQRGGWIAAGLVCVGVGVAAGELVAAVTSPTVSPVSAVGQSVIDGMPSGVKDWAIGLFGTGDKSVFLASMILVIALLAATVGVLEGRRRGFGLAGIGVFGVLGIAAVATRAGVTSMAFLAPVVAAAVAGMLLAWVGRRFLRPAAATLHQPTLDGPTRRSFVRTMGVGAGVAVVAAGASVLIRRAAVVVVDLRARVRLPSPAIAAPPVPAGAVLGVPGVTELITPADAFYRIDTALVVPAVNSGTWQLRVTGRVDREVTLDFAQLLAKPMVEKYVTIGCVSNEVGGDLVGNARWLGWPVRELLALAGVQPGADMVLSRSTDGFTAGTPLAALTDAREAIIAVGMNGGPLPLEHGYPARLIVPGLYGYVSATKWLAELKVTTFAADQGYWSPRGWSALGPIKTASRIDVPRRGDTPGAGTIMAGGVAWAPERGISGVQVQLDDGPWQDAVLAAALNKDTWVQWKAPLAVAAGRHVLAVRAIDGAGAVQTSVPAPPAPDGATGHHTVEFTVG